jgi:hypothetical protein
MIRPRSSPPRGRSQHVAVSGATVAQAPLIGRPAVENYWRQCDPHYCDRPNAESFTDLLRRIEGRSPGSSFCDASRVFLFTHGQRMQSLRLKLLFLPASDAETWLGSSSSIAPIHRPRRNRVPTLGETNDPIKIMSATVIRG